MRARGTLAVLVLALAAGAVIRLALPEAGGDRQAQHPRARTAGAVERRAADMAASAPQLGAPDEAGSTRAAVPPEEHRPGRAEIEIRDASSAPLAAARWAILRGEQVLAGGKTAEDGLARFAPRTGTGELFVLPPGSALQRFAVELAAERQVVLLPAGSAVAGRVRVDGFEPAEPLMLDLHQAEEEMLPKPLLEALGGDLLACGAVPTASGPGGAFRFEGLPPDWSGWLAWEGDLYAMPGQAPQGEEHDEDRVRLASPVEDLKLELSSGWRLTGTVVDPSTGSGIDGWVIARYRYGDFQEERETESGPDGRFSYEFMHGLPERVELCVSLPEGAGTRTAAFDVPHGVLTHDVGPVAILTTRTVRFAVRDAAGHPIADAEVRAQPADGDCGYADEAGVGSLGVPLTSLGLRASAEGFELMDVPLPLGDELVLIVMRPGTVVEVRVPPGPHWLGMEVAGEPPFLNRGRPSWEPETDGAFGGASSNGEQWHLTLRHRDDGVYVLSDVRPGVALALELRDRYGAFVQTIVAPLRAGERRVVELALPGAPRSLAGRVIDAAGRPIPQAKVVLGAVGTEWGGQGVITDGEGSFLFEGVRAASMLLFAEADGYAKLVIEEQPITAEPLELVLDAGRTVRVAVVGPDGEPVPVRHAGIRKGRRWVAGARPEEPGIFAFEQVPRSACTLRVFAGGSEFLQPLPPGVTEARIELPPWRPCTVRVKGWAGQLINDDAFVTLRFLDAPPGRRSDQGRKRSSEDTVRFEALFPGRYETFLTRLGEPPGTPLPRLSTTAVFDVVPDASGAPVEVTVTLQELR